MPSNESTTVTYRNGLILLISFTLIKLFIHLITNIWGGYGIFRDELYYIACSSHPDIGYVDQPPLSIYILAINRFILGDSIFALRFLPAAAGAITVFLTGLIARDLGGRIYAQAIACIASIVALSNLAYNTIYSMNAFDVLFWTLASYIVIRIINRNSTRDWLLLGVVMGLGAFNKIGALWLMAGFMTGFLFTPHRTWFRTRWPWLAAVIAFVIFLPFIIWNFNHDFAHLEFIRNATQGKYSGLTPGTFIIGQFLIQNPVTLPLWLAGLYFYLFSKKGKPFRPLGIAYVTVFLILIINGHSKPDYLAPAYGMLFGSGGVIFEEWFSKHFLRLLKPVYISLLIIGLSTAPIVLPILPVEAYIRYADALGIKPITPESKQLDKLPQFYADMFGWEEKAAAVAAVFHRLTPEEQMKCAIFGDNYGRCGAIDFYGKKYNLPPSIGRHNNYWIWGHRNYTGELVIILGGDLSDKQERFGSVEIAGTVTNQYCMPYENNLNIYVCRKLNIPLKEFWPQLRHYD